MTKQQLIETITSEIIKNVSTKIREIVREEIDIETKRLRKKLLEEFRGDSNGAYQQPIASPSFPLKKTKIDTGDRAINSILEEIQSGIDGMAPDIKFAPETTIADISKTQKITENHQIVNQNSGLYKPPPGEGYNFDPRTMEPSQIDWGPMIDALEAKTPGVKQ